MSLPATLHPILHVWTHRNYAFFMGGMTPNLVTLWMQRVGIGWLAWELTHSPIWLGIIAAADLAPMLVLAPFAGAVTDRGDPLYQHKVTQTLSVGQGAALAILTYAEWMSIEILFVLSLFLGCVHPFSSTARHAIVPATVPRSEFATAIAMDSALFNASRFVGPAIAGLLIPAVGVGGTFAVNAVGCMIFLGALFCMKLPPPKREGHGRRNILSDVTDSFAYVHGHIGIGLLFLIMTVISVFMRPVQDMLPGFAGDVFERGAVGLAWLTSSMGIGAMVSATWIAMRGRISGLTSIAVTGCLGLAISVFGFVATEYFWLAVIFCAFTGFTLNNVSTSSQALIQSAVTDEMRGRVMGLFTLIYRGTPAFGALAIGGLAETMGLRWTFAISAAICFASWIVIVRRWRAVTAVLEGERPKPVPSTEAKGMAATGDTSGDKG